jgi:hypothetical protein
MVDQIAGHLLYLQANSRALALLPGPGSRLLHTIAFFSTQRFVYLPFLGTFAFKTYFIFFILLGTPIKSADT